MMLKSIFASVIVGAFALGTLNGFATELSGTPAADPNTDSSIPVFHQVSPEIYRGGRPGHAGMAEISKLGVRTDLDLENDDDAIRDETAQAHSLGIRFVSLPMSGFFAPSDQTVNAALALLEDSANYPIFVHCQHGEDRTGLIVGLYRVLHEGWQPAKAYDEMKQLGFHPLLLGLNHYFEKRTGYDD